jgi:2-dehydro-3-deoxy-D-arabinonate dehydratase
VWAAGVTYRRSLDARTAESSRRTVYDLVYEADRPELFFKCPVRRVVGPGDAVGIRSDSSWDVPEPELTLAINACGEIVGYTLGNDMSSRSIEGANPLYLPQAKTYERSCAIGPVVVPAWEVPRPEEITIDLSILRARDAVFRAGISVGSMRRSLADLVSYLTRALEFPHGVFLLTGTGIVPPDDFTLQQGDEVHISSPTIGELVNTVVPV